MFPPIRSAGAARDGARDNVRDNGEVAVRVRLLGPFSVVARGRAAGPWPRPSARRLCQLVLVSPGRRVSRDLACEELFPGLDPRAAARSVSKALSMARAALAGLDEPGEPALPALLQADLTHIWARPDAEVDATQHERALRAALALDPGRDRDARLAAALAEDGELLADEPYADWALRPRERLEALRQEARLALARDRAKGASDAKPEAVLAAWAACAEHDPASEEAAAALVRGYFAAGQRELAVRAYERCRAALGELGLRLSPWLEEVYATAAFEAAPPRTQAPARDELRTVTVLAAEVAADGKDPEELRDVAGRCLAAVIAEVEALGGTVTSVSGGGLQAMFGAPEAHEDDPERAARAAFRALAAVVAIGKGTLRIGVETGSAVLGPIGGGARVEYGAVGEVVGRAAALQALARPGSALVGPVTRAAVGNLFAWGEEVPVNGMGPAAYLGAPMPRIAGRRLRPGGPLVGRQPELTALGTALREAARGHGSVVLVTGEPGLGKTRLVQECRKRVVRGTRWLEGSCASYASSTPYGLYQQLLANWAGVTPDQPAAVVGAALERALAAERGGGLFPLLARMMGLPPGAALGRLGPGELQKQTFAAWRSLVARLVAAGPVVLVVEDLHWADPTSLRLTLDLARLAAGRRLLVLTTSRPESAPALDSLDARRLALAPLPGAAEEELARSLMGEGTSREVLDAVLSRADGNPLFLEERLSALLETRALVRERGTWRISPTAGVQVPQALERMVRSRVDRLSPAARDAVRPASVLGIEFPLSLLAAVCAADELGPALAELRAKDFLHEVAGRAEPVYRFRHALIQEATYNGLLRAERRLLHGRAAWALEAAAEGRTDEVAAVLGRHFAAAGEPDRALRYFEQAGDHATASFANDEAISSFRSALAIAGEGEAPVTLQVDLQAKLANVLWRTGRRGQAREAFQAALRVVAADDTLRRAHLLTRLGRLEVADNHYEAAWAAYDAAEELLGGDPAEMDAATVEEWLELMVDGRACQYTTEHQVEQALAALDAVRPVIGRGSAVRKHGYYFHLAMARVAQNRFRVDETDLDNARRSLAAARDAEEKDVGYATFFLARFLLLHGDLAEAEAHLEHSLAMAERIGETGLLGYSLLGLAVAALRRHDTAAVRTLLPRVLAEAESMASPDYLAGAKACLAWLAWQDRQPDDVIKLAEEIATLMTGIPDAGIYYGPVHLWPLAAVHLDAGQLAEAVAATRRLRDYAQPPASQQGADLDAALAAASQAWDQDQPDLARDHLTAALDLARELGYL